MQAPPLNLCLLNQPSIVSHVRSYAATAIRSTERRSLVCTPHKNLAEARGRSDREIYMQLPVHVIVDCQA